MDSSDSSEFEDEFAVDFERKKYVFRPRVEWFANLSRAAFKERFRLYPTQAEQLLTIIGKRIAPKANTNHALSAKQRMMVALRFLASGSLYWQVSDSEHITKGTVHMCVRKVTEAVNKELNNIDWPAEDYLRRRIAADYFRISRGRHGQLPGFPLCIGALDGTLVNVEPPRDVEYQFVDRHGKHSINIQGVAGPDYTFYSLSANWPGSVNDSRVFRNSSLSQRFEAGFRPIEGGVLIGDSIYPVKDFLVPMRAIVADHFEEFFNALARCRWTIECSWALLKNRFRCLKDTLRMKKPSNCGEVVMACGRLHNFLIQNKEENEDYQEYLVGLEEEAAEENEIIQGNPNQILENENLRNVYQTFVTVNNLQQQ